MVGDFLFLSVLNPSYYVPKTQSYALPGLGAVLSLITPRGRVYPQLDAITKILNLSISPR